MVDHVREHSKLHVKALYLTQICSLSFETETETIYDFPNKKNYTQFVLVIVRTILGYDGKVVHTQKAHRPHRSPDYNVKHSYSAKYLKLHQIQ